MHVKKSGDSEDLGYDDLEPDEFPPFVAGTDVDEFDPASLGVVLHRVLSIAKSIVEVPSDGSVFNKHASIMTWSP